MNRCSCCYWILISSIHHGGIRGIVGIAQHINIFVLWQLILIVILRTWLIAFTFCIFNMAYQHSRQHQQIIFISSNFIFIITMQQLSTTSSHVMLIFVDVEIRIGKGRNGPTSSSILILYLRLKNLTFCTRSVMRSDYSSSSFYIGLVSHYRNRYFFFVTKTL